MINESCLGGKNEIMEAAKRLGNRDLDSRRHTCVSSFDFFSEILSLG